MSTVENHAANSPGWSYRLWSDKDINEHNFPFTYKYIQKAMQIHNNPNLNINKLSTVGDLMKYEIMYHYGGFYADVNMELFRSVEHLTNETFVVANENSDDVPREYLSCGFFAVPARSKYMFRLMNDSLLASINMTDRAANIQTGPYYFRNAVREEDMGDLTIMRERDIYPSRVYDECFHLFPEIPEKDIKQKNGLTGKVTLQKKCAAGRVYSRATSRWRKNQRGEGCLDFPCTRYPGALMTDHFIFGSSW